MQHAMEVAAGRTAESKGQRHEDGNFLLRR